MRSAFFTLVLIVVCVSAPGCANKPSAKSAVEAKVKEALKFKDVSLTEEPDGTFKGTGTDDKGARYELAVTREEKGMRVQGKSEKGDYKRALITAP